MLGVYLFDVSDPATGEREIGRLIAVTRDADSATEWRLAALHDSPDATTAIIESSQPFPRHLSRNALPYGDATTVFPGKREREA